MAEDQIAMTEVMYLLEVEPSSGPVGVVPDFAGPGPNIAALHEQLAVLVSTGKAKDAIGVQITHEQLKRLSDKDVEKYYKRYESSVGAKTTDSLIDSFIFLASKVVGMAVDIKDIDAYQKELKNDYMINKELSNLAGSLTLKCGRFLALANVALITTKHINFAERTAEQKVEEITEQFSTTAEQVHNNFEEFLINKKRVIFALT